MGVPYFSNLASCTRFSFVNKLDNHKLSISILILLGAIIKNYGELKLAKGRLNFVAAPWQQIQSRPKI